MAIKTLPSDITSCFYQCYGSKMKKKKNLSSQTDSLVINSFLVLRGARGKTGSTSISCIFCTYTVKKIMDVFEAAFLAFVPWVVCTPKFYEFFCW